MTRAESATYLRRSTGTLTNWAAQRKSPVYYSQEGGAVVYAVEDNGDWLAAQRVLLRAAWWLTTKHGEVPERGCPHQHCH